MDISSNLIDSLYKRFSRRPATLDERNLRLLADYIVEDRGVSLCDDRLVFTEMSSDSPFREILLENIHGVADLGRMLAVVLHSSIIFLDCRTLEAFVHVKPAENIFYRIIAYFRKKKYLCER